MNITTHLPIRLPDDLFCSEAERNARRVLRDLEGTLDGLVASGVLDRDAAELLLEAAESKLEQQLGHEIRPTPVDRMNDLVRSIRSLHDRGESHTVLGFSRARSSEAPIGREDVLAMLESETGLDIGELLGALAEPEAIEGLEGVERGEALRLLVLAFLLQAMVTAPLEEEAPHECPPHALRG